MQVDLGIYYLHSCTGSTLFFGCFFHEKILSFKIAMSKGYVNFILHWNSLSIMLLGIFMAQNKSSFH